MEAQPLLLALLVIGLWFVINRHREQRNRLRCGAYNGPFSRCHTPVHLPHYRCAKHKGLPRRYWP